MSILKALNELGAINKSEINKDKTNKSTFDKDTFDSAAFHRQEIIRMSRLHVDNLGILYKTNGVYLKKFFGVPMTGKWNYKATGLYFGTPTILVGLFESKSINLTWCAKDLSTGKLIYLPYWCNCPLIWQENIIKSS